LVYKVENITHPLVQQILNNLRTETNIEFNSLEGIIYESLQKSIRQHSDNTYLLVDYIASVCFMIQHFKNRVVTIQKKINNKLANFPKIKLYVGHGDRYPFNSYY